MQASCSFPVRKLPVTVSLSVDNLLDTAYRDYLNRYRYYADDAGRNITIRVKVPF
jgi:iron complex outermembrane receptor protein